MTFIDLEFLIFLLCGIIVFYICPVKYRWIALLGISTVFYAIAGLEYLPFIFVTSLSVWLAGKKMGAYYDKQNLELENKELTRDDKKALKEKYKSKCKKVIAGVLVLNIAILCVVKFTKFFENPINDLIAFMGGKEDSFSAASIIVPLGISYYTFSSLSYLLDVYWKRVGYEKNYFRFLLYLIYFPHILQGPIERYGKLGVRLKQELRFDYDRVVSGIQLMLWGYFKKLVIADRITQFIDAAYGDYWNANSLILILSMFLDVIYIYADFSGCMDMARGMSQIFGIELDLNFDHPFSSRSVTEFWRRWHMTLGGWFKDYVYYPISTSRLVKNISKSTRGKVSPKIAKALVTVIPVSVTWVLTGVWHGTGLTYIAWGVYYATMIFLSVTFEDDMKKLTQKLKINTTTNSWRLFQMARTTVIFAGGRLLTRPGTLHKSAAIVYYTLKNFRPWELFSSEISQYGLTTPELVIAVIAIAIFGYVSHLQIKGSVREMLKQENLVTRWVLYLALIFAVLIYGVYGPGFDLAAFVYMAY